MTIPVSTHISLKTWTEDAAPQLFALIDKNREYLAPWLPWVPFVQVESDSLSFIQGASSDPTSEKGVEFGIWLDDTLVGCLGLHAIDGLNKKTSVGYWLDADHQGKGIMTESVRRLVEYCFTDLDLNRVELRAATTNTASLAVAERLGFTKEGVLREAEITNGQPLDNVIFSLLRREFIVARSNDEDR